MSQPSVDAQAVVRAAEALTTQVRRIADAMETPVVTDGRAADDGPTSPATTWRPGPLAVAEAAEWTRQAGKVSTTIEALTANAGCADHPNAGSVGPYCLACTIVPAPAADEDECRLVEVDGETVRVRGAGEMTEESRAALASLIAVAKQRLEAEHAAPDAKHLRALAFNAVSAALRARGDWLPLTARRAAADAVIEAILPGARIVAFLARDSESTVQRVVALHERWIAAGPPPLGASVSRWWDARLAELHNAILPPEQTGTDHSKEQ
ncbi:hypothetical protein [Streptomyces antibioticus]|uniref:hypothetical protein n=1 Tax=Streptomyces antibioticus TaxID=1890 RepID=UPI003703264A